MANDLSLYSLNARVAAIETNGGVSQGTISAVNVIEDENHKFVTTIQMGLWDAKASTAVVTTTVNGLMSYDDKIKLNGISNGAEANQNAFSLVKVGATTINSTAKLDTLELVAGSNIVLTPDVATRKVVIANNYSYAHPTGDGNLHVPSTGTSNNGKFLKAGATAGNLSWSGLTIADVSSLQTSLDGKAASTHGHTGGEISSAVLNATTAAACSGNSATATKLQTARTISLTGDVTGSASFDGSANASITTTVANDSHTHTTATLPAYPTSLPANGGNSDTVDSCHAGTSANNVLKLDSNGLVPNANISSAVRTSSIAFCMVNPEDNQQTPRFYAYKTLYMKEIEIYIKTAVTADTVFDLYYTTSGQADTLIKSTTVFANQNGVGSTWSQTINSGSFIYAIVKGAANGCDLVTIQLVVDVY